MISSPLTTTSAERLPLLDSAGPAVPVLLGTVVFSIGIALANPFMLELIPAVGSEKLVGTYYGYFYLVSALAAAGISAGVGALLGLDEAATRWAPFAALAAIGALGGAVILVMQRRGTLNEVLPESADAANPA